MKGKTIFIAIVVLCVCASVIVGALYAAGVIGGSPSSSGGSKSSSPVMTPAPSPGPSGTPAPSPGSSGTPSHTPAAYSGPSYASAPAPAPAPDACTPNGQPTTTTDGSDCCSHLKDGDGNCFTACTLPGQPAPAPGTGQCCQVELNGMCVFCIPDGSPAPNGFCCSQSGIDSSGNCNPRPVPCVLGPQISSDNACASAPCGVDYFEHVTYSVSTPARYGGECITEKTVACPPNPCPLISTTPGQAPGVGVSAGTGSRASGSRCFHDQDCDSGSCSRQRCD